MTDNWEDIKANVKYGGEEDGSFITASEIIGQFHYCNTSRATIHWKARTVAQYIPDTYNIGHNGTLGQLVDSEKVVTDSFHYK